MIKIVIFLITIVSIKYFLILLYSTKRKKKYMSTNADNIPRGQGNSRKNNLLSMILLRRFVEGFILYNIVLLGKIPSNTYRRLILKYIYKMDIADNAVIHYGCRIRDPWNITIGAGSIIGDGVYLDGRRGIIVGENVNISTEVYIWTLQHNVNDSHFGTEGGRVIIENRAWISCRATILPNCKVYEGAVLAAGAVLTKDCEEFGIYGGVPAKLIGVRNRELMYSFRSEDSIWFI